MAKKKNLKKKLRNILFIIVIAAAGYFTYSFFANKQSFVKGTSLIPSDAIAIIELKDPLGAWGKISSAPFWEELRKNKKLQSIDSSFQSLDSLVSTVEWLRPILKNQHLLVSLHPHKKENEMLIVADLRTLGLFSKWNKKLLSLLGDEYIVSEKDYKGYVITELFDVKEKEITYLGSVNNQLIISFNKSLIENSINQINKENTWDKATFTEISKSTNNSGITRVFYNYKSLHNPENSIDDFNEYLSQTMTYSGISFDISGSGNLVLSGLTGINDSTNSYFKAVLESGSGNISMFDIAPQRTAALISIGFNDFISFKLKLDEAWKEDDPIDYAEVNTSILKIEKFFDFSLQENLYSWIDDEIGILHISPSIKGKTAEMALVLKAKNERDATENMKLLNTRIKENTPGFKFKEIEYKSHSIQYLKIGGFFKLLFGKLIKKMEKPYYTIVDKYVIFSNNPETLKSIIDDYSAKKTLNYDTDTRKFMKKFSSRANITVFANSIFMMPHINEFVSKEMYTEINSFKSAIENFPYFVVQLNNDNMHFANDIQLAFSTELKEKYIEIFEKTLVSTNNSAPNNVVEEDPYSIPKIYIENLDAKKHEEFYEDGTLKLKVDLKKGQKDGPFRYYYPSGELHIKGYFKKDNPMGAWTFYDEEGNEIVEKMID